MERDFPATILVPMSALMAISIVPLLRWTAGSLEFEVLGNTQLKGTSGPRTLRVVCFLSLVFAFWLLWPLESKPAP